VRQPPDRRQPLLVATELAPNRIRLQFHFLGKNEARLLATTLVQWLGRRDSTHLIVEFDNKFDHCLNFLFRGYFQFAAHRSFENCPLVSFFFFFVPLASLPLGQQHNVVKVRRITVKRRAAAQRASVEQQRRLVLLEKRIGAARQRLTRACVAVAVNQHHAAAAFAIGVVAIVRLGDAAKRIADLLGGFLARHGRNHVAPAAHDELVEHARRKHLVALVGVVRDSKLTPTLWIAAIRLQVARHKADLWLVYRVSPFIFEAAGAMRLPSDAVEIVTGFDAQL
jgi:hypothetical protein